MKLTKILAGVSALAMAATSTAVVSADAVTEEEIAVTQETVVLPEASETDEELDKDFMLSEKPARPEVDNAEKPERPETDDAERPERPETDDAERPERPETDDAEKSERPETDDAEKSERPERPEITMDRESIDNMMDFYEKTMNYLEHLKENGDIELPEFDQIGKIKVDKDLSKDDFKNEKRPEGKHAFSDFTGLEEIEVDEENEELISVDGVLFDKEMKVLISYPDNKADKEYKVPDSVKKISEFAFDNCKNLEKIELPEGLKIIGEGAFRNNEKLENVNVPADLEKVDDKAFDECSKINDEVKAAAEKHANIKYGDLNRDGKVDMSDLTDMALTNLKEKNLDESQEIAADVVDDGKVDLADLATLKQHIIGFNVELGPEI